MKKNLPIGLRTVKTALAVTLAVLLVRLYSDNNDSIFYAAMGAAVGMDITVTKSLRQGLTQLISVFCGTIMGFLSLQFFPTMPALVVGLGVLLLIIICNALKINFSISLSCIIFLSAALTSSPEDNLWMDAVLRMRNTTVGVLIALLVNVTIHPYNNKSRIIAMLRAHQRRIIHLLDAIVLRGDAPDLQPAVELLWQMDAELKLYHAQRLFHKNKDDEALLRGCRQLCGRMLQELEVISGMDCLGTLSGENAALLQALGLSLPEEDQPGNGTEQDTTVMNYHIGKLLAANRYMDELLSQEGRITPSPPA